MTNKLKRMVHKKEWQKMDDTPTPTVAGAFYIKDPLGVRKTALAVYSAALQYVYQVEEDGHVQIPSLGLTGTFGAGACGAWSRWSNALTATGGSTTSATLEKNINNLCIGRKIRFLTGANAGLDMEITDMKQNPGGTITLFFGAFPNAVVNTDTFAVSTGRYWILSAGTLAAGCFKSYDPLTGVATSLSITNLPATWGTDGKLVGTPSYVGSFSSGTATVATSTTLSTGKSMTLNSFANAYQVRITGGTGRGQIRVINSNTVGGQLTVASAWTVTPDVTSTYEIEGNDDYLYLMGNNTVTLYRYQISTNTWSVITPSVARAGAFATGGGACWISKTGNAQWALDSDIQDGRYIYSFRGGASAALDRYDIALNLWAVITYTNNGETFTTGSSYDGDGQRIYARKDATNRFFYYDVIGNCMIGFIRNATADGVALAGDKLFTATYTDPDDNTKTLTWLYSIFNTGQLMYRVLVI